MSKAELEHKSLAIIILAGYTINFLCSTAGYMSGYGTIEQLLFYQVGNAFAISASVMAGRYIGLKGQHVAASAYILLGITHGISLAALNKAGINMDRGVTMAIPMIPSLCFMFWCSLYPVWLRALGIVPIIFCVLIYFDVQSGQQQFKWALSSGYGALEVIEITWGIYIFKDWKQSLAANNKS